MTCNTPSQVGQVANLMPMTPIVQSVLIHSQKISSSSHLTQTTTLFLWVVHSNALSNKATTYT